MVVRIAIFIDFQEFAFDFHFSKGCVHVSSIFIDLRLFFIDFVIFSYNFMDFDRFS